MSTRSYISRLNDNGSVSGIYCHFDGYTDGVGKMLLENYADARKLDSLLSLGDISCLGPDIDVETIAYARDKGEDLEPLTTYTTIDEMLSNVWNELGAEYVYLHDGNGWKYAEIFDEKVLKTL